ncbi:uncharacterized protein LOC125230607 [Leguminivora glycinivorella]|uniref:uncharacterized protein LOC125230607 n=1 Tax=Leguminivora glycinivorella TaxID=1035111 RepID=UPI00200D1493|nr:uncharacterized protein LOC125230607 [Leguminivora glycinivorella]
MKLLLLLVALCSVAAAMVPRQRRAMEDNQSPAVQKPICEPKTPCGWIFYKENIEFLHERWERTNDYCICATTLTCQEDENDSTGKAIIKRCKVPAPPAQES